MSLIIFSKYGKGQNREVEFVDRHFYYHQAPIRRVLNNSSQTKNEKEKKFFHLTIKMKAEHIKFYNPKEEYGVFSNYYGKEQNKAFKLVYDDVHYASVEHFFQAQKFAGPGASKKSLRYSKLIATQSTANKAKILANQKRGGGYKWRTDLNVIIDEFSDVKIRKDWEEIKDDIMRLGICLKMHQNPQIWKLLQSTGGAKISEHTARDKYWGDGGDGKGKDMLGKILMEIRDAKKH